MAAVADSPVMVGARSRWAYVGLAAMAVVATATAVFDVVSHPHGGTERLVAVRDYVFTGLLIPFAMAMAMALSGLRRIASGRDGALGRAGFVVAVVGLAGFVLAGVLTLISADATAGGPLYPLALLASLVGLMLMSVGWVRSHASPRWALWLLTAAWFFGGPAAEGTGSPWSFRGAALILAAICVTVAVALGGRAAARS